MSAAFVLIPIVAHSGKKANRVFYQNAGRCPDPPKGASPLWNPILRGNFIAALNIPESDWPMYPERLGKSQPPFPATGSAFFLPPRKFPCIFVKKQKKIGKNQ